MAATGIILILFIGYSLLIFFFQKAWRQSPSFVAQPINGNTTVSIIIAARNEGQNISALLHALDLQTYPKDKLEIIVVDDHSTDNTSEVVQRFPFVTLLTLNEDVANSYKKKAIEKGVSLANGELIITTDADCVMGKDWITSIVSLYEQTDAAFIAAPVSFMPYSKGSRLLYSFQVVDFLVLQGITGAVVASNKLSMCNGANLAYKRKAFFAVNAFTGIDHIASGDDMLLMHKIRKAYPGKIQYLKSKDVIVYTQAETNWTSFFNQRIRWASKADKYDDKNIFYILLLVYLFNVSFAALAIAGWWNHYYWLLLGALWLAKTVIEFRFVQQVAAFFDRQSLMKYFFVLQPLHILYTIVAGWLGKFGKYKWKGRTVK